MIGLTERAGAQTDWLRADDRIVRTQIQLMIVINVNSAPVGALWDGRRCQWRRGSLLFLFLFLLLLSDLPVNARRTTDRGDNVRR